MKTKSMFGLLCALVLSIAIAQPVLATPRKHTSDQQRSTESNGDITLRYNAHVMKYVPRDIQSIGQTTSVRCDENGDATNDVTGHCLRYRSASTHSTLEIRYVQPSGAAERIFVVREKVVDGRKVEFLEKHVVFDAKHLPQTLFVSDEAASQYAANEGSPPPNAVAGNPNAVAAQTAQLQDCAHARGLDKLRCIANNAAIGAAVKSGR